MTIVQLGLWVVSLPVMVALLVFSAEILAGLLAAMLRPAASPSCAAADVSAGRLNQACILMPAHNEAKVIAATIAATQAVMPSGDRLVIIADNCDDDTAAIARSCGAEVVERYDPDRRGKGYALDFGLSTLRADPPSCVVILDADCRPQPGALQRIADLARQTGRPVQACYLLEPDTRSGPVTRFSSFAFMIKNRVRQRGMSALSGTCVLTGSGMAFPWTVIAAASLGDGEIVEDLVLGLRLALTGHPPLYAPDAQILSDPAPNDRAAEAQRGRWERGFVSAAIRFAPRLLGSAIVSLSRGQGWLALHLLVPPFVLLFISALALSLVQAVAATLSSGPPAAAWLTGGLTSAALISVGIAWLVCGRAYLRLSDLLALPRYLWSKLGIWGQVSAFRAATWNRTER